MRIKMIKKGEHKVECYKKDGLKVVLAEDLMYASFISSFGLHWQLGNEIHKMFDECGEAKALYAKENEMFELDVYESYSPRESLVNKKADALYRTGDKEVVEALHKLFEKGHNRYSRFVESKGYLDLGDIITKVATDIEGNIVMPAFIYHQLAIGGEVADNSHYRDVVEDVRKTNVLFSNYNLETFRNLTEQKEKEALERFQKLTGTKIKKETNIDTILRHIEGNTIKKLAQSRVFTNGVDYGKLYKHPDVFNFKRLTAIIFMEKLNELYIFTKVPFPKEEYFKFYLTYLTNVERGRAKDTEEDFKAFFAEYLIVFGLIAAYKQSNALVDEIINSEAEIEQEKKSIEEEKMIVQKKEREIVSAVTSKEKQWEEEKATLLKRIEELERIQKNQESVDVEYEELKKEVIGLREYVFENMNDEIVEIEEAEQTLQEVVKKGVYIGGHPKKVKKLKELLPNTRFVGPRDLGVNLSFLENAEFVCFDTSHNNHGMYYKVKELKLDQKIHYIHEGISIGQVLNKIK